MTGFIIYFTLLSIVHLFFCYFGMHTPRKLTKPLLLTSLAACYACAAKPVDYAVLAALICGLAGDILLIWERTDRLFISGALSFALGHGLYALSIFRRTPGMTRSHLITAAVFIAAYIAVVACMSFRLEKHVDDKKFRVLMPVYLGIVAAGLFIRIFIQRLNKRNKSFPCGHALRPKPDIAEAQQRLRRNICYHHREIRPFNIAHEHAARKYCVRSQEQH